MVSPARTVDGPLKLTFPAADTTGTMANTLVLAFAGSSLNMMVLIFSYRVSFLQLMNTDFIAANVPNSTELILEGETHTSHIVHNTKIAEIILELTGKK